jgi:hypothetical protein
VKNSLRVMAHRRSGAFYGEGKRACPSGVPTA